MAAAFSALAFRIVARPIRLNRLRRHHDADPVLPHRRPNLLDLRQRRAGRRAGERQQPHVLVRLRRAGGIFRLAHLRQKVANLLHLPRRAADQQAPRGDVGVDARGRRIGLLLVEAAEELGDREHGHLRIDRRERNHRHLAGVALHLLDRGPNRRLLGRPGEGHQMAGHRIDRQPNRLCRLPAASAESAAPTADRPS